MRMRKLKRIKLDWQVIASPSDPEPPTTVTNSWDGPLQRREIGPFSGELLIFEFTKDAQWAEYYVEVTFFNGCQAAAGGN